MKKALSVKSLTKTYANGIHALKSINLDVNIGDFFALLGQNGAGKSTTIGIISSLVVKTSGAVSVFGHDMDQDQYYAKSCIGVVPQEMNFSLFENISQILIQQAGYYGIPRRIAAKRAEHYLGEVGLWDMRHLPAIQLSGGMKRRLMIARALMNEPKLLVLDEPTAGVDIEVRHSLWKFLRNLNAQGTTIILTTHYLEEAEQLCKNIAILDHGEIIENTTMKELLNRLPVQTLVLDLAIPMEHPPQTLGQIYRLKLIDTMTLEIELRREQNLNDLFAILNQHHVVVTSMRNKTNRLEELFIYLITENKKNDR
jgi:ABC-2 type transport system ATP-binding protein